MTKIKKDIIDRLRHFPTTILAMLIIIMGLTLVFLGKIDIINFTAFCGVSLPFFFMKKEQIK